jgi:hypothetical protein
LRNPVVGKGADLSLSLALSLSLSRAFARPVNKRVLFIIARARRAIKGKRRGRRRDDQVPVIKKKQREAVVVNCILLYVYAVQRK